MKEIVYIVDAEASVRRSLKRLLTSFSMEVSSFASLEELTAGHRPAVERVCLILDQATVCDEADLKEVVGAQGEEVQIIVMTTHDGDAARQLARSLGAVICLQKPVDAQALVDSIRWGFSENG